MGFIDTITARSGRFLKEDNSVTNIIERVTGGVKQIDTDHKYIHEGAFFSASIKFTLTPGSIKYIGLETPPDLYIHYRNERVVSSGDKVTIELIEAPAFTRSASLIIGYNHKRIGTPPAATVVLCDTPTAISGGTTINQSFIGGGTGQGQARSGEDVTAANEYILKRNAKYLIKITNGSSANNIIQVNPLWYEEISA
jgi:hypothetical protein